MELITSFKSLSDFIEYFKDEQFCQDYLESMRWDTEPECPHCHSREVYRYTDGKSFKCKPCRKKFTVRVGTIFEGSKISLRKWFIAIYIFTNKEVITSVQLAKDIRVTQKSAWYVLQRIRYAFEIQDAPELVKSVENGEIEANTQLKNKVVVA